MATTTRFGLVLVSLKIRALRRACRFGSRYWLSEVFGAAPRLDGMTGTPFQLELEAGDDALVDELVAQGAERIGIDGLLRQRGRRIWRAWTRGSAARHGFRWSLRDTFDGTWWPQGIDVAEQDGRRMLAVSWFARDRGVRLSFVDLRRRRYHHVLLVEPVRDDGGRVRWIRSSSMRAASPGSRTGSSSPTPSEACGSSGWTTCSGPPTARRSCRRGRAFTPARPRATAGCGSRSSPLEHTDGAPRLVAGEYGDGSRADRAARFSLDGEVDVELHEPGLYRMQGIVIVNGVWYVTTSNGERRPGDLWIGTPGAFVRHRHVLPPGPEDLAYDRSAGRLWSLSEWPGRRRVFQIDPTSLVDLSGRSARAAAAAR